MYKVFKQIGKDTIILTIGSISTKALGFILLPLYTRTFSVSEYGTIEIVNIVAQMAGIVMALSIPSAFNREFLQISDTEEQRKETLSTSFLFISVFSFFVMVIAIAFSGKLAFCLNLNNSIVPSLFRLIFIKTYFLTLGIITLRYMIVTGKMTAYAFLSFLWAAFAIMVSIWVLLIQKKGLYELYLYQTILAAFFGICYSIFLFHRAGLHWSGKRLYRMLHFAIPMVPAAISFYIMTSADRFFLQKLTSTSDVGIYGVAYRIGLLSQMLIVIPLTTSISPAIYRIAKREDSGIIIQRLFEITCFIFIASAVGLSLASPYLVRLLAPAPYWSASSVVIWISVAYALYGLNFVLIAGIHISGKSYYGTIAIAIAAVLNLILNYLLIPYWGITGAAIATTIAYFIQTLLTGLFAQHLYLIPYRFIRTSVIAFIVFLSYWILNSIPVEPLTITIITKFLFFILILSITSIIFFRKEVLAVWDKIHHIFILRNSRG